MVYKVDGRENDPQSRYGRENLLSRYGRKIVYKEDMVGK